MRSNVSDVLPSAVKRSLAEFGGDLRPRGGTWTYGSCRRRAHGRRQEYLPAKQNFAVIIVGGTGQVGAAAVVELLATSECREVVMLNAVFWPSPKCHF